MGLLEVEGFNRKAEWTCIKEAAALGVLEVGLLVF